MREKVSAKVESFGRNIETHADCHGSDEEGGGGGNDHPESVAIHAADLVGVLEAVTGGDEQSEIELRTPRSKSVTMAGKPGKAKENICRSATERPPPKNR